MADNLTQVLTKYTLYVDSSSLMHGNMEFFKISLFNVLKSTNRKLKVVDFVVKDLKKKQFSDNEKFAVKALKIIDFYRKHNLVEDIITSGIEQGKILDVIYNNRNVDKDNICVITENKELANEIVTNLSGVDFNYKIAAVRLINGPALWNIKTVKPRVMPIKNNERKGVSFGIDSPSLKEDDQAIKGVSFSSPNIESVSIDSIPEIDSFNPQSNTIKDYRQERINEVKEPKPTPQRREYHTPSYNEPDYNEPEYSTPTHSRPTHARQEEPRPETRRPEPVRQEPVRQEPRRTEPVRPEPRREEPRRETPRQVPPRQEFKPVNKTSRQKRSKLVVSIIVDNSSSLNEERQKLMKDALNMFDTSIQNSDIKNDLDYAIYAFDGFSPRVLKGYDGEFDVNRFDNGGIQVLGKTIELAMDELVARQKLYQSHNIETHKPWLIILTDGGAYGDITDQVKKLKTVVRGKKITYFPFNLNTMELDETLQPLAKLKMFLKVKEDLYDDLLMFLYNTISQRINTPDDVPMTLDRQALARFIAR